MEDMKKRIANLERVVAGLSEQAAEHIQEEHSQLQKQIKNWLGSVREAEAKNVEGYTAAEGSDYPTDAELREAEQVFNKPTDREGIELTCDSMKANDVEFEVEVEGQEECELDLFVDGNRIPVTISIDANGYSAYVTRNIEVDNAYATLEYTDVVHHMTEDQLRKLKGWVEYALSRK
tara:strand:+ start:498 stop:1028 length:531 start_codon:yes stop_codon:yes gene_type:complete